MSPFNAVSRAVHAVSHRHFFGRKTGVGEFIACGWRLSRNVDVMFHPDLQDAGWHYITDMDTMEQMLTAPDAHAAMAMLRSEPKEAQ